MFWQKKSNNVFFAAFSDIYSFSADFFLLVALILKLNLYLCHRFGEKSGLIESIQKMANTNLANAKTAKNDEFYTQYPDIQKEINAYLDFDPNVFRGKTVLLPCDDPEWSNFTKFFAQNFELLGLKKLISTSYAPESKKYKMPYQPTLFETEQPHFDADKSKTHGKIFVLERRRPACNDAGEAARAPRLDINNLQWQYLEGDGDFRSKEIRKLRDGDLYYIVDGKSELPYRRILIRKKQ